MKPTDIAKAYDQITHLWNPEQFNGQNGIQQHQTAMAFSNKRGFALDVGCGPTGRFIQLLKEEGYTPEGVDISTKMLDIAQRNHPTIQFYCEDICAWQPPKKYDFITGWDSLWHVPLDQQKPVITKLIDSLSQDGVFIFSFGGTDTAGDKTDRFMGPEVYYSTLGVNGVLATVMDAGGTCRHLEYDQSVEDCHAYLIVQKR